MFEVRRDMLVMRMSGPQVRVIWMGLAIVPKKFLRTLPNLVTIPINYNWQPVCNQSLAGHQADTRVEMQFTIDPGERGPAPHQDKCGVANAREPFRKGVEEQFVILQGAQCIAHALSWTNPARVGRPFWSRSISFR